jgi:hypothetical protein
MGTKKSPPQGMGTKKSPPQGMGTKKSPPQGMGIKKNTPLWGVRVFVVAAMIWNIAVLLSGIPQSFSPQFICTHFLLFQYDIKKKHWRN